MYLEFFNWKSVFCGPSSLKSDIQKLYKLSDKCPASYHQSIVQSAINCPPFLDAEFFVAENPHPNPKICIYTHRSEFFEAILYTKKRNSRGSLLIGKLHRFLIRWKAIYRVGPFSSCGTGEIVAITTSANESWSGEISYTSWLFTATSVSGRAPDQRPQYVSHIAFYDCIISL